MTYKDLAKLSGEAVVKTMEEGKKNYPKDDFLYRPMKEHRDHAHNHMRFFDTTYDPDELEHALTRIVIMLAKIRDDEHDTKRKA